MSRSDHDANDRPTPGLILALALGLALAAAVARSADAESTDALVFSTSDQSLWGPVPGVQTKGFEVDVLDIHETGQAGNIRTVTVTLDNGDAVAAWEQAVQTCDDTSYSYTVCIIPNPFGGCIQSATYTFSPSRQQCIDGYDPPGPTGYIAGIGAAPAGSVDRDFQVGAVLSWDEVLNTGVSGELVIDQGSVDVTANLTATLRATPSDAGPGEIVTLQTAQTTGDVDMATTWPSVDMNLSAFIEAGARVDAQVAGPDTETGDQRLENHTILDVGTGGRETLELLGLKVSVTDGLEFRALGEPFFAIEDGYVHNQAIEVVAGPAGSLGLPLFDAGIFTPEMETPVADPASFLGIASNGFYTSVAGYSGSITNAVAPGERLAVSILGTPTDGIQDTDVSRLDLDVDILAAAAGAPMGFVAELVPIPVAGPLLEVEGNALDVDLTMYMGFREEFRFEPNLRVDLQFSQPVTVEVEPGVWQPVSSIEVPVGDSVNLVHPGAGLVVTPVYTLADNRFSNDTDFVLEPGFTQELLSARLGGLIYDLAGAPAGLPADFAVGSTTVPITQQPIKLVDMNYLDETCPDEACAAVFPLAGFQDVVGTPLVVGGAEAPDSDGDLVADADDNCLETPNASQLDADLDGYGNACDADVNNDGMIAGPDLLEFYGAYGAQLGDARYDATLDVDGDGAIGGSEIIFATGAYGRTPGPSGLSCAGTAPCD